MRKYFGNAIDKDAIINSKTLKLRINFKGKVNNYGDAYELKELYNTKIKLTNEQNIILDKNFDNHVGKSAIIGQSKHKVIK